MAETTAAQAPKEARVEVGEADEFAALLKQSFRPRTERAATEVENAVNTLVEQALADASVVKSDVLDTIEEMMARLDKKLSAQMNEIMHAPEFQQIEAAWRGLAYLVSQSETDAMLKIRVINISKNELYRHLRQFPNAAWDQSGLFKKVYEEEFGQLGGQPYGCLIGDYHFSHQPTDVQLLRDISKIAGAAHAPFFAAADSSLMGMDSWNELMNPRDLSKLFDTPDYAAWRSLRDSDDARYIGLCLPRVLARLPYGAKTEPVAEFGFEEDTDGHKGEKYAWMNAAYAMAANINRAFKEYGWCARIRGGVDLKCPTEIAITDRREAELAKSGLIPLIHRKNTDRAAFIGAQSLFKPRAYQNNPEATASSNLSSRLPYMFATCRFAHYLKVIVRDWVGRYKEKEQLERDLNNWIADYIDGDPVNSSEDVKCRRPLAAAAIHIQENEENPGYYAATIDLRPHFQLEGMDIGLRLVSRLKKAG
jgi:type VI secretion system protein ImpC